MRYTGNRVNEVLSWLKDEARHLETWQQRRLGGEFGVRAHLGGCSIADYMYRYTVVISLRVMLVAGSFYFYFSSRFFREGWEILGMSGRSSGTPVWQGGRFFGEMMSTWSCQKPCRSGPDGSSGTSRSVVGAVTLPPLAPRHVPGSPRKLTAVPIRTHTHYTPQYTVPSTFVEPSISPSSLTPLGRVHGCFSRSGNYVKPVVNRRTVSGQPGGLRSGAGGGVCRKKFSANVPLGSRNCQDPPCLMGPHCNLGPAKPDWTGQR
ncbi:uncharacterized protein B0T15DRAFT_124065 [Chaetomium strumarium]|uniref:Uncharacterized protein n=1 Tax=Chaetomium strumarium TaxID=1170767 RepID=A0AAJ0M4N7_9PEZI|nr:hypothetical protein B0T15DRAFT_124065 [Chaetomium strumarium]